MAKFWLKKCDDQRKWIADHGRTRAGYIIRYSNYGMDGSAIWDAHTAELDEAEEKAVEAKKVLGLSL